ncbi:MAG: L-glutamate gamma-semialdehyde dehydrogenase [Planctomycetes bacterium]|nr:L-glutamate gamma-semialdehyde dehydrogenase [Planctomycetota bacterium]
MNLLASRVADAELERLTHSYGSELFARVDRRGPTFFTPSWLDERLMEWTMSDEAVKLQLFRFIDVLPLLNSPQTVSRHLREYFEEAHESLPGVVRFGVRWMPRQGVGARLLAWAARNNANRLARRFIAGSDLGEALATIAQLRRRKLAFTIDLLGEATITESEAQKSQEVYLHLVEGLSPQVNAWPNIDLIDRDHQGPLPRVNVSIKLSSLYSQFDPIDPAGTSAAVRDRLRPILRAARRKGVFVNIDMEQHSFKDVTLQIFKEILEEPEFVDWPDVGIAIQAYLKCCERDLNELEDWARRRGAPVWVRLIKGAYWDYETVIAAQENWPVPVWERKWETDANYERLSLFLLENSEVLRPAFGSHNIRSLAYAMAAAQVLGIPDNSYEIQMLYGMADPFKEALVGLGRRVRVYTPYGQLLPGMAYLVRRLLENTANESFLRASFTEHASEEKLLMNPSNQSFTNGRDHLSLAEGNGQPATNGQRPMTNALFHNEPLNDFSDERSRTSMQAALSEVKKQLGRSYPLVINGRNVTTADWIDSLNPSHVREVVGKCAKATVANAKDAINAAVEAFPNWRDTDADSRADYLVKAAEVMRRRKFELSAWEVYECGKQWREADADVAEAIDFCDYYAAEMRRLAGRHANVFPGEENVYLYEPRGVVVVIAPWNFPLAILCGMTTAALVAGNTVVMKPAEPSAVIAAKLMEVFQESGFPPGVVNYLSGKGREIGPMMVEHPETALVAFTGSLGVGMLLNQQLAQLAPGQTHIKKLIAELGGKNAVIIDDDADLDEAVSGVVQSAFGYQGQKCSACSRVIVLEVLHDVFLERLIEATRSLKIGPAEDPACRLGPVIDAAARQTINDYIEKGKQEARLAYAGDIGFLVNEGFYVAPHIFADVKPDAVIAQEEIFGPVLAVLKVKDLDEALRVANGTAYALTGGLYSRSPENIKRVKREFRVGNLYINRKITGALVCRQPFGGFKLSGIGSKAGGPDYLLHFLLPRAITENTMRRGFAPSAEKVPYV